MRRRDYCYMNVVPFCAMVAVECSSAVLSILFKAATQKGLSYYVFIAYSYAISTFVFLLPVPFILCRSTGLPTFKVSLLSRIFLLGVIGFLLQLIGYKGLEYSSPTLSSALSNLVPAFTFILAILFRMEKATLTSSSTHAKITGSIISIIGALVVTFYKGPVVLSSAQSPSIYSPKLGQQSQLDWVLGAFLLASAYALLSLWYIVQTQVMKEYPVELLVVFLYNLCGTLVSAPACLLLQSSFSVWRLNPDITLTTVIYSGFCGCLSNLVHTWGLHLKGPVYISIFKPLSIVIAAAMSVIFLGDALFLGSVIGAGILSIGFYAIIWGKAKSEEMSEECWLERTHSPCNSKTPLLQSQESKENRV